MEMHDGSAKVVFDMKEKGTRQPDTAVLLPEK
jgi:hypothetical protein